MNRIWHYLSTIWHAEFAWGGMLFVAASLTALLIVPTWQNDTLTTLRDQNVSLAQFLDDINDLEIALQDMRLASRGYIITQNVLFHQQYNDASARQQAVIAKLVQDAIVLQTSSDVAELHKLKRLIDNWRLQRLDHQVSLVEDGRVAEAEADFVQGMKVRAFDGIRESIDKLQYSVRATQRIIQDETLRVHAFNLRTNTVLAIVALAALILVFVEVLRQAHLLIALTHAKSESQQLMQALSDRIDEIHHQNTRIVTAQDIVTKTMHYGDDNYRSDQVVNIIQQTLNVPGVVVWFDIIDADSMVVAHAIHPPMTIDDIMQSIDPAIISRVKSTTASHETRRILGSKYDITFYSLGHAERSIGVLGIVSHDNKVLDALTLMQITLLIDNYRLFTALQREQGRLRVLFDVVPLGFVLVNEQGRILVTNQQASLLLPGILPEHMIQTIFESMQLCGIGGARIAVSELPLMMSLAGLPTFTVEVMHEINNERIPVRHQVMAIGDDVAVHGYVLMLEDMRQRYELDRLKADFVSMITHELRTPLATIVGATTMLLNSEQKPTHDRQHNMLQLLQTQGQRLQSLIEDVLNISRIDSEGIQLNREIIDVLPLVQRVIAKHAFQNQRINIVTQGEIEQIYCDVHRVEQVLHNILDNAKKYAPPGNVEITLTQLRQTPQMVQFAIRDYGLPLSEKEYTRVFDRFYQANHSTKQAGVGLGLSICKYYVEAHGGEISMTATPHGDGTVVTFTLPTTVQRGNAMQKRGFERVLVVEDDFAIQKVISYLLQTDGFDVVPANSIFQAQELIERNHFDVIIVDIMLPDGSGLTFVRDVRLWSTIPIMVVTALAGEQDVVNGLRAGVDDYMVKPFNNDEFLLRIQALCRRGQMRTQYPLDAVITIGDIQITLLDKQVQVNGVILELTPIESRLMRFFVRHIGQILSHEQILQGVWGERYEQENQYLWVHLSHLRRKLQQHDVRNLRIENVRGIGYRMHYQADGHA